MQIVIEYKLVEANKSILSSNIPSKISVSNTDSKNVFRNRNYPM